MRGLGEDVLEGIWIGLEGVMREGVEGFGVRCDCQVARCTPVFFERYCQTTTYDCRACTT